MRYFLQLSYLGKAYNGWQIQPNAPSVQQTLQQSLGTLLRRPVEDHRGILRRGRGRVPEEAVVQGAQSRSGLLQPAGLCRLSGCIRPGGTLCAGRQPAPGQQQIGRTARQT